MLDPLVTSGANSEVAAEVDSTEYCLAEAVVFMPCCELFEEQDAAYRKKVLGSAPRVAVEAAAQHGWDRWIGENGIFIGVTGFGASASAAELYRHFGITPDAVTQAAFDLVKKE